MRRNLSIVLVIVIVLAVLVGLSAVSMIKLDRDPETEANPKRSTYNSGPTGLRAFYQLLEESGKPVTRWRRRYEDLSQGKDGNLLILAGPYASGYHPDLDELLELNRWVNDGGRLLIISRTPDEQFADPALRVNYPVKDEAWTKPIEELTAESSDSLIVQPTVFTRGVRDLRISTLASRIRAEVHNTDSTPANGHTSPPPPPAPVATSPVPPPPPPAVNPSPIATPAADTVSSAEEVSTVKPDSARTADGDEKTAEKPAPGSDEGEDEDKGSDQLFAPIVHLGDRGGAILADFEYGKGRVVFLSDPFVVANNGISRGGNLTLAMNIIEDMAPKNVKILFDEMHHGFREEENQLFTYLRGSPAPWLLAQGVLIAALMAFSYSRRFARPLPLPREDRHSPLEFVGSMANLQKIASARDLAIENIYPPFRSKLCGKLGVPPRADRHEIAAALRRLEQRRVDLFGVSESEMVHLIKECEGALAGAPIDDHELVTHIRMIRKIEEAMRTSRPSGRQ